jgi:ABC-type amino acid transport substrate-binding protein
VASRGNAVSTLQITRAGPARGWNVIKRDEPRFAKFVDDTLMELEKSGEAERIVAKWFVPVERPFEFKAE